MTETENDMKINDLELLSKKIRDLIYYETDRLEKENDRLSTKLMNIRAIIWGENENV